MKAQEFQSWCSAMKLETAGDSAQELGAARNTGQIWFALAREGKDVPIKRTTALVMSALYHRLDEWRAP